MTDAVEPSQKWECNEARADPGKVPDPHDVGLWESHRRFVAVVDRVEDDYVEMTVSRTNDHPDSPSFRDSVVTTTSKLLTQDRWRRV